VQNGCKRYVVLADELENAIEDLIVRERASEGYEDNVRALLMEKEEFRKAAAGAIVTARARLDSVLTEQRNLTSYIAQAVGKGLVEEASTDLLPI
jgi:hypothetical protein